MRVLDELAEALQNLRGRRRPKPVVASLTLRDQFALPINPTIWRKLEIELGCQLPAIERTIEGWRFPGGWTTVKDLAKYLEGEFPEWQRPSSCSTEDWREAQIFAIVRQTIMEAGNVSKEETVRSARLIADLGLE